jgi:hypothetical protein
MICDDNLKGERFLESVDYFCLRLDKLEVEVNMSEGDI